MATALQQYCGEATELQVLRANKEIWDIKEPGFWKVEKANVEAVQANLKADFQQIAIKHHKEITKLLTKQREYVKKIEQEALTVAKPISTMTDHDDENILHILEDEEEDPEESG